MDNDPDVHNPCKQKEVERWVISRATAAGARAIMQEASRRSRGPWGRRHKEGGRANEEGGHDQARGQMHEAGEQSEGEGPGARTGSRHSRVQWTLGGEKAQRLREESELVMCNEETWICL